MKDSVRAALAHLRQSAAPGPDDVWLMAPADMPELSSRVVDRLIAAASQFPGEILVPRAGGRRGHPVLFPFAFSNHVERLGPDEGLNRLLELLPVRELEWPAEAAEEAVPDDLDTPADYARALESGRSRC
jgi:molybdenum cofactor cytidylyltransferase